MNTCKLGQVRTRRGVCVTPIKLESGGLSKYGYKDVKTMSELARHRALHRVIRGGEPPLGLFRKLNALMVLFKYKDPKLSKIFKADRDYVKREFLR